MLFALEVSQDNISELLNSISFLLHNHSTYWFDIPSFGPLACWHLKDIWYKDIILPFAIFFFISSKISIDCQQIIPACMTLFFVHKSVIIDLLSILKPLEPRTG